MEDSNGFFPFNAGTEGEAPKYHFGMNFNTTFNMTQNGKTNTGEDIIFEFTGDDDIWIYIDGKLVIDLGGIHDPISASINFASDTITT